MMLLLLLLLLLLGHKGNQLVDVIHDHLQLREPAMVHQQLRENVQVLDTLVQIHLLRLLRVLQTTQRGCPHGRELVELCTHIIARHGDAEPRKTHAQRECQCFHKLKGRHCVILSQCCARFVTQALDDGDKFLNAENRIGEIFQSVFFWDVMWCAGDG